jgi:hypothetical protein
MMDSIQYVKIGIERTSFDGTCSYLTLPASLLCVAGTYQAYLSQKSGGGAKKKEGHMSRVYQVLYGAIRKQFSVSSPQPFPPPGDPPPHPHIFKAIFFEYSNISYYYFSFLFVLFSF